MREPNGAVEMEVVGCGLQPIGGCGVKATTLVATGIGSDSPPPQGALVCAATDLS